MRKEGIERVPSAQSAPARSTDLRTPIPRHRIGPDAWLCRMIFKVEEMLNIAFGMGWRFIIKITSNIVTHISIRCMCKHINTC